MDLSNNWYTGGHALELNAVSFLFWLIWRLNTKFESYMILNWVENDFMKLSMSGFQSLTFFLVQSLFLNLETHHHRTSVFSWHNSAVLHINCGLKFPENLNKCIVLSHFSMIFLHSAWEIAETLDRKDESALLVNSPSFLLLKQLSRDLSHMNPTFWKLWFSINLYMQTGHLLQCMSH